MRLLVILAAALLAAAVAEDARAQESSLPLDVESVNRSAGRTPILVVAEAQPVKDPSRPQATTPQKNGPKNPAARKAGDTAVTSPESGPQAGVPPRPIVMAGVSDVSY